MKHLIILGDGMADWAVPSLGNKTLLQHADTPAMDWLARNGRCGMLKTIPDGFHPGSEVANSSILGYDQHLVYEGRGPLEAASIGVELEPGDLAMRCNLVCIEGDIIKNHSCGRLETEEGDVLIRYLNEHLANDRIHFYTGVQYRHLLVIKGGNKHLHCTPPHDVPMQTWRDKMPTAMPAPDGSAVGEDSVSTLSAEETAALLCDLICRSQELLPQHPLNKERAREGKDMASSIWPWGGGYRPQMIPLTERFPEIRHGSVITAVDLIRGIGRYAGLRVINVPGATGLYDTNFEGKAQAAIDALLGTDPAAPAGGDDFVYLHVEASDEAGHDGSVPLKLQTIEDLDHRLIQPILKAFYHAPAAEHPSGPSSAQDPVLGPSSALGPVLGGSSAEPPLAIALLPDHPTPCELRTHTAEPIPFAIYYPGIEPDGVQTFDEAAAREGAYGQLEGDEFIKEFMKTPSSFPLKGEGGYLQSL